MSEAKPSMSNVGFLKTPLGVVYDVDSGLEKGQGKQETTQETVEWLR